MKGENGEPLWIVVTGWEDFQHRDMARSKVPPWLKVFTRLLSDDDYLALTWEQRGLLHGIWLEYARSLRQLRASRTSLSRRLGLTVRASQLEALRDAGFITLSASKPASNPASEVASPDGEGEGEKKQPRAVLVSSNAAAGHHDPDHDAAHAGHEQPFDLKAIGTHVDHALAEARRIFP